jgi:hypothetical protein
MHLIDAEMPGVFCLMAARMPIPVDIFRDLSPRFGNFKVVPATFPDVILHS